MKYYLILPVMLSSYIDNIVGGLVSLNYGVQCAYDSGKPSITTPGNVCSLIALIIEKDMDAKEVHKEIVEMLTLRKIKYYAFTLLQVQAGKIAIDIGNIIQATKETIINTKNNLPKPKPKIEPGPYAKNTIIPFKKKDDGIIDDEPSK